MFLALYFPFLKFFLRVLQHSALQEQFQLPIEKQRGSSQQRPVVNEKVTEMEDQLITVNTYLRFAPVHSNSHLVRELKLRIKEIERVLAHAKGSNLPRG